MHFSQSPGKFILKQIKQGGKISYKPTLFFGDDHLSIALVQCYLRQCDQKIRTSSLLQSIQKPLRAIPERFKTIVNVQNLAEIEGIAI